jgi:protein-S-isoprenylcysteine O-methyltransferase Ste14
MTLFDPRVLGIVILFLLSMLVTIKQVATGFILDRPKGNFLVLLVNSFNLFFLLVLNPLAAILLIARRLEIIAPAPWATDRLWILIVLEVAGLVIYVLGFLLMDWALILLGCNYQLGGSAPRSEDQMVVGGPYRVIRHPMYSAALSICLGLACLTRSWVVFGLFCIYLVLILRLIPLEEAGLQKAFGAQYGVYRQKTRGLVPFVF